ncbi:hypothetical protein FACS1894203_5520 [Bacteroidia bacterium]|nr:hypothetical protein FACS1894203_5520 [Bacteroidia bacterium]
MKTHKQFKMRFTESAYNEIINTIASRPAESGGLLIGREDDFIVRKFLFDKGAKTTRTTYSFDTNYLNPEIKRLWDEEGLSCIGFIHSHPHGYESPSSPDIQYFSSMFKSMPRKLYLTPIVQTVNDGGFKLIPHILMNGDVKPLRADTIEILPDNFEEKTAILPEIAEMPQGEKEMGRDSFTEEIRSIKELLAQIASKKPNKIQQIEQLLYVILLAWGTFLAIPFGCSIIYMLIKIISKL